MKADPALLAVLIEIRDGVRAIEAELKAKNDPDREVRARLLCEIRRHSQGLAFLSQDLCLAAEITALGEGDKRLHKVITEAVGGLNVKKLGNLLAEIEGQEFGGLTIRRTRNTRDGVRWKIA